MSYRIVYGEEPLCYRRNQLRLRNVARYTLVCIVLFAVLTVGFWPSGRDALLEAILPGDAAVTRQAIVNMAENLKSGEAIGDAVTVFCREIVDGANLTP